MAKWPGFWVAAVLLGTSGRAFAEDLPVTLTLNGCDQLNEGAVRRITAAELGATAAEETGPEVTEVTVNCDGTHVGIHVKDPISRKAVQRSFDIGLSDPRARERLVALAATELVLASWAELRVNPEPRVEPEGPRPSARHKDEASRAAEHFFQVETYEPQYRPWYVAEAPRDTKLRILGEGSMRSFFSEPATLFGGGLRVAENPFRFVSWATDILFEDGAVTTDRAGSFDLKTLTVGAVLLAYMRSGRFTAGIGGGLRAGLVASSPRSAGSQSGSAGLAPWGWPLGALSVSIEPGGGIVIDVSGEVGYTVLPVPSAQDSEIRTGWFGAQVGIGFLP